jgi:hypothetical protein|tara:strand:+ start:133 stop:564 length:432 start_codon:yes stop_codon:yes gene_type:complete
MIELVYIPNDLVDSAWKNVEKDIADALARSNGYALAANIKQWIKDKKMQLWILWDKEDKNQYYGVVVTEILQRPLKRCLNIRIMTGHHRDKWQHLIKNIEKFAWDNKCDSMELIARPGWQKELSRYGYQRTHVVLEKHKKENK